MNINNTLLNLTEGKSATVKKIKASGSIRRRLQDLGVVEGTTIECIGKSPFGDPVAYYIKGAVIAIRSEDSANIIIA